MQIGDWLKELHYKEVSGPLNTPVDEVIYDSRKARPGAVFVCIRGTKTDSHRFIGPVLKAGVRVIVAERGVDDELASCGLSSGELATVTVILVENGRRSLCELSSARFGRPQEKLTTIAVTGTKGKTTTAHMIRAILEAAGHKTGMIGTIGITIGDEVRHTLNTTPESYEILEAFSRMLAVGCTHVVMEVSSQGIKMHRVDVITFDYAVFTNLSPDHIGPGEHADFAEYLSCKARLFSMCRTGFLNCADAHFKEIQKEASCAVYTYALGREADYMAGNVHPVSGGGFVGTEFDFSGKEKFKIELGIPGRFNVENALAAASLCSFMGIDGAIIRKALRQIRVNGRMEVVHSSDKCTVLVDYAHNAVSMESLLTALRAYARGRLVVVFGCGGNRAKERRYRMGEIGGRLADLSIITEDNSRFERVEDILADIRGSIEGTGGAYVEIPDRRQAIEYSIRNAKRGDLIAVIGKGHEDYQEICGVRTHFLDREEILKAVEKIKAEGLEV